MTNQLEDVKFLVSYIPPVDLHWFFEISIRTEKKIQLELKKQDLKKS